MLEVLQFILEFHQTWQSRQTKPKLQPSSDLPLFSSMQNIWKVEVAFLNGFLNLIRFLEGEWSGIAGRFMVWECVVGCCVCHEETDDLLPVPLIHCVYPSLSLAPHPALGVPHPHSCSHLSHLLSFSCSARNNSTIPAFPMERKEKAHPDTEQGAFPRHLLLFLGNSGSS